MIFSDINPYIRFARYETITPFQNHITYSAYDNRIFICIEGQGTITVNNISYIMKPGTLLMWNGGEKYVYSTDDFMLLAACNFDYTCNHIYANTAIPPKIGTLILPEQRMENIYFDDMLAFNKPIYMEDASKLLKLMSSIIEEFETKFFYYEKKCCGLMIELLSEIARSTSIDAPLNSHQITTEIIEFIKKNYMKKITNETIGVALNYHPNYINRLIKNSTGLSLHKYVILYRINVAITILRPSNMSVTEISSKVGFCDVMHFSNYFKKITGKSPSFYRTNNM